MSAVSWPTHKAKARSRQTSKLAKKKRGIKLRRLHKDGKRRVISRELN